MFPSRILSKLLLLLLAFQRVTSFHFWPVSGWCGKLFDEVTSYRHSEPILAIDRANGRGATLLGGISGSELRSLTGGVLSFSSRLRIQWRERKEKKNYIRDKWKVKLTSNSVSKERTKSYPKILILRPIPLRKTTFSGRWENSIFFSKRCLIVNLWFSLLKVITRYCSLNSIYRGKHP